MKSTKSQETISKDKPETGIRTKIGRTYLHIDWDTRQWIYTFGKTGPLYLTSVESIYNQLIDDLAKYKKSPLDVQKLKQTLVLAKQEMLKLIKDVGNELDSKRRLQKTTNGTK
jgi:hypothetical protein